MQETKEQSPLKAGSGQTNANNPNVHNFGASVLGELRFRWQVSRSSYPPVKDRLGDKPVLIIFCYLKFNLSATQHILL